MARVDWGEFEYDGHGLLYNGHARMPPDQLPSFLLTADGDDRPHAWWIAQTKLYDLKTSDKPSIREIRELLAHAIRHNRLVVPELLREAERNADAFLRLSSARDAFARRHHPPPTPRTSPPPSSTKSRGPATPSRPSSPGGPSPRQSQASPGAMPLQGMLAHPTLMSLPLAAPVPVPGPTPHAIPLFTMMSQGGIPVPAPGPNPPPLVPAYARYAAYTTVAPPRATPAAHTPAHTAANSPTPQHGKPPEDEDGEQDERQSSPAVAAEIDELAEEDAATRPTSKNGPSTSAPQDVQPDRPKKRSRPTRAHPSSPRVCTTCSRTDSPEWRRGPYGPKTLCNACGLKWAKASGAGRRRGAQANAPAPAEAWAKEAAYVGPAYSPTAPPPGAYPQAYPPTPTGPPIPSDHVTDHRDHRMDDPRDLRREERRHGDMISRPGTADAFRNGEGHGRDVVMRPGTGDLVRSETAPELARAHDARNGLAPIAMSLPGPMSAGPPLTAIGPPSGSLGSSLPSSVGLSAPIGNVPPPPHSSSGSESADESRVKVEERDREREVKSESDVASGLMDLANVALEGRRDIDRRVSDEPPQSQSLKRPRADSSYDRLSSSSASSGQRFVDGARQGPGGYADGGRGYDSARPYVDSREFSERRFEGHPGGGSRPIDVIPIGGDKW